MVEMPEIVRNVIFFRYLMCAAHTHTHTHIESEKERMNEKRNRPSFQPAVVLQRLLYFVLMLYYNAIISFTWCLGAQTAAFQAQTSYTPTIQPPNEFVYYFVATSRYRRLLLGKRKSIIFFMYVIHLSTLEVYLSLEMDIFYCMEAKLAKKI